MSIEALWSWLGTTAAVVGLITGVWWALADFILDRVGSAPADWSSHDLR